MTDETTPVQDTPPDTAANQVAPAAAPVDQVPEPEGLSARDQALVTALVRALNSGPADVGPLAAAVPVYQPPAAPAPQPAMPAPALNPRAPRAEQAFAAAQRVVPASAPVDQPPTPAPAPEVPYAEVFKPGSLAVHTYDHFGRETHQVLLVLSTYQVELTDKQGRKTGEIQDRVRFLPIGVANEAGDLPADAPELLPASEFDWQEPA